MIAEAAAAASVMPLPCETDTDSDIGRQACTTGRPTRSSRVIEPIRVIPKACLLAIRRATSLDVSRSPSSGPRSRAAADRTASATPAAGGASMPPITVLTSLIQILRLSLRGAAGEPGTDELRRPRMIAPPSRLVLQRREDG